MERIEFENGSIIEKLSTNKDSIRSKSKFIIDDFNKLVAIEALRIGLKLEVRENELKKLQNNEYIQEYYKLNIKRLNRWWYSVYFDEKPYETIE